MIGGEPRPPVIIIGDPKDFERQSPEEREGKRRTKVTFSFVLVVCAIAAWVFLRPSASVGTGVIVTLVPDAPFTTLVVSMKERDIIRSEVLLRALVAVYGDETRIPAGEYYIAPGSWLPTIAKQLAHGDHKIPRIKVTFPEGQTNKQYADILAARIPDFDETAFLSLADKDEGYLFPNTYEFFATVNPEQVVRTLKDEFDDQITGVKDRLGGSGRTLADIVTMASIIEGEVRTPEDRAIVSGILWKRIAERMPLQVDATFVYLLGKGSEDLTIDDLSVDSPYNTYKNKGLPPTPINNPGIDAILAAAEPKASPYFFYLTDVEGVVHYARTFDEHKQNKAKYLR